MAELIHAALQPAWDCIGCGRPWPCDQAREELVGRFARRQHKLAIYMAERLGEAAAALYRVPPDELYERFIEWTRHASSPEPGAP
jgi:hypothetical protein